MFFIIINRLKTPKTILVLFTNAEFDCSNANIVVYDANQSPLYDYCATKQSEIDKFYFTVDAKYVVMRVSLKTGAVSGIFNFNFFDTMANEATTITTTSTTTTQTTMPSTTSSSSTTQTTILSTITISSSTPSNSSTETSQTTQTTKTTDPTNLSTRGNIGTEALLRFLRYLSILNRF